MNGWIDLQRWASMTLSLWRLAILSLCIVVTLFPIDGANATPRCEGKLLRAEIADRQNTTLSLLKEKKYADLQRRMDAFLSAYAEGRISDEELFYEFGAFDHWGPFLEPLIQEWVTRYPKSFAALHALSLYTTAVAWQLRGNNLARDTSDQQFRDFDKRLRAARDLSMRSLELHAKPILAYQQLMANAKGLKFDLRFDASQAGAGTFSQEPSMASPRPDVLPILRESLRVQPDNTVVRETYTALLAPRWGGSLDSLVAYSKASAHPGMPADRLAAVSYAATMEIASDYRFRKQLDAAAAVFEIASRICRLNQPLVDIANVRLGQDRFDEALKAAEGALSLVPDSSAGSLLKAKALRGLARHIEAVALLQRVAAEGIPEVSYLLGEYYASGDGGLPRDVAQARRLLGHASRAGNESATKRLQTLN